MSCVCIFIYFYESPLFFNFLNVIRFFFPFFFLCTERKNKLDIFTNQFSNLSHIGDLVDSRIKHPRVVLKKDDIVDLSLLPKISFNKSSNCKNNNKIKSYNRKNSQRKIIRKVKKAIFNIKKKRDKESCLELKKILEILKNVLLNEKDCDFEDLLIREGYIQPVVKVEPLSNADQYYVCKKKRRKTEQEKLIDSLTKNELVHVDGAFKRSTNTQYQNLNEDKLFNNLFDNKKKKKQGNICSEDDGSVSVNKVANEEMEVETERFKVTRTEEVGVKQLVKKKRKSEKDKLIDSLSDVEKIHVDGAFKRNCFNFICNPNNNDSVDQLISVNLFEKEKIADNLENVIKNDASVARVT